MQNEVGPREGGVFKNHFRAVSIASHEAKRGRSLVVRARCDKINWWVSRSLGKPKANKKSKTRFADEAKKMVHVGKPSWLFLMLQMKLWLRD
ncbi:hypothetical protein V6N13_019027 [Hibiscus sabdariffa]|uniref:Uncharacterized protein n=1 Tax=Hibiscus sabdariffa TaxID=183260 RepID=A0ABR2EK47_9ROSI